MAQPGRLSAFLASISVLPWMVPFTDSQVTSVALPPAPQLFLSPSHNIFVQGEQVYLLCIIPGGQRGNQFWFREQKADGGWMEAKSQKEYTFEVSTTYPKLNKIFACSYLGRDSGGTLSQSALSNNVMLSIIESPLWPNLSLQPQFPVYIQGEVVTLTCSAPSVLPLVRYTFYEEREGQYLEVQPKDRHKTNTLRLDGTTAGQFHCVYWFWISGREIQSQWSNSVSVTRTVFPQPPTLSLWPQYSIYIQGEAVRFICSAPAQPDLTGYTFWEERGGQSLQLQPKTSSNTFTLGGMSTGWFYCVYWFRVSGREIQSSRSSSIRVTRTGLPQPPTLSLQPQHPVYILGEEVTLNCSVENKAAEFSFYQQRSVWFSVLQPRSHNNVCRLDGKLAGMFQCRCWIQVSGRKIMTQLSNSVSVDRTDPLPPPVLKVDPPSGAVNEEELLLISCLTNRSNTEKRFHFYRDRVEMNISNEEFLRRSSEPGDPSPDAALSIPQANSSYSGEIACSYEENMSSRWVPSPLSQAVNVLVYAQDSSLPASVYACFTLLLLIPVVSLACYYCWRRKKASKGQEEFHPPQNQEEMDNLRRLELQVVSSQLQAEARLKRQKPVEEDGVSYSEIQFRHPNKPNRQKPVGEEGVSYSEIQFRPLHGLNRLKPVGEDGVTYSEIQVRPTHKAAK
ncbi:Fc receptor-like protein 5 isoform X1 [Tiliqua scincoides]|uniref:Fc receptor-like protein 5 isoform X1 n=1 Tax=Tiliqua scincoides TaxID=71010 RepID=UPI00346236E1